MTLEEHRKEFETWARLQGAPFFSIEYMRTSRTTSKAYESFDKDAWTVWQAAIKQVAV